MIKRRLGINSNCLGLNNLPETLKKIRDTGFDCFYTSSHTYTVKDVLPLKELGEKIGLDFEFIHAPFVGINDMWNKTDDTPLLYTTTIESIDAAKTADVKYIILHVSSGWNPPDINEYGLRRYDELVDYAVKNGVTIAFENLRKFGHLAYIMDRYDNVPEVAFCYDSGHEFCYTEKYDFLNIYGKKTVCTHIHDNLGKNIERKDGGDLHLLPFDGKVDFKKMMKSLNKNNYDGALTLEVSNKSKPELNQDMFLKTAFERLKKISKLK